MLEKTLLMHVDDERSKIPVLLPGLLQQNNVEELHKLPYKGITGILSMWNDLHQVGHPDILSDSAILNCSCSFWHIIIANPYSTEMDEHTAMYRIQSSVGWRDITYLSSPLPLRSHRHP